MKFPRRPHSISDIIWSKKKKKKQRCKFNALPVDDARARLSNPSKSAEILKVHVEFFHSGGATTLAFIVDGINAVSSLVMRLRITVNVAVILTTRHWRTTQKRMSTSHFEKEAPWKALAPLPVELGRNNTFA